MFIPAFVLALFIYSFFDVRFKRKQVAAGWKNDEHLELHLQFKQEIDSCRFFLVFDTGETIERMEPRAGLSFAVPQHKGEVKLLILGRFDIFRATIALPKVPEPKHEQSGKLAELGELYFLLRPFEEGDQLRRIDALQTAKRDELYVRRIIHEAPARRRRKRSGKMQMALLANYPIFPKKNVELARIIEWLIIAILIVAAHLEWRMMWFTLLCIGSSGFILTWQYVLKWRAPGRKLMNTVALFLFFACFAEGGIMDDTVLAGSHFLILLSIWKHWFVRERRDAFTYIFLALFVFVALSLYTLNAWFFFLFFGFLLLSIALFSLYAAGEREEEIKYCFERPLERRSYIKMNLIVLLSTFALFFVLPHGDRAKDTSLIEKQEDVMKTGFSEEVNLNDMLSIMQDFGKQFVVENANSRDIPYFHDLYWRGMRFTEFKEGTWHKPKINDTRYDTINDTSIPTKQLRVRYYPEGERNIFIPAAAMNVNGSFFSHPMGDQTLLTFARPKYNDITIDITVPVDEQGLVPEHQYQFKSIDSLDDETKALFEQFWETIPENAKTDPQLLSSFIQNNAGFTYSLTETAPNLQSFLYDSKQGHCEYFATVLALTLWHFGYNATYVNGFTGGEWNDSGQMWVVRGADAHSWVEVFDETTGWQRFDPTPSSNETFFARRSNNLLQQAVQFYDYIELRWFEYVVSFSGERQKQLLRGIFEHRRTIFYSIIIFFVARRLRRFYKAKIRPALQRTPVERFLWWLSKKTKQSVFALDSLNKRYPELTNQTRDLVFGTDPTKKQLQQLKSRWRKVL